MRRPTKTVRLQAKPTAKAVQLSLTQKQFERVLENYEERAADLLISSNGRRRYNMYSSLIYGALREIKLSFAADVKSDRVQVYPLNTRALNNLFWYMENFDREEVEVVFHNELSFETSMFKDSFVNEKIYATYQAALSYILYLCGINVDSFSMEALRPGQIQKITDTYTESKGNRKLNMELINRMVTNKIRKVTSFAQRAESEAIKDTGFFWINLLQANVQYLDRLCAGVPNLKKFIQSNQF